MICYFLPSSSSCSLFVVIESWKLRKDLALKEMGKTSKWLRSILTGKKVKEKEKKKENCQADHNNFSHSANENPTTPISNSQTAPKDKKRWSFRRSSASAAAAPPTEESKSAEQVATTTPPIIQAALDAENEHKKHAMAVAVATAAAADAAVAAAQAAAAVIRLAAAAGNGKSSAIEEAAAVKIQSLFRSYLARKALRALKGLVKLQALVRGHLVRKQATATLRCMQTLVTMQARARAHRIQVVDDTKHVVNHRASTHRKSVQDNWLRHPYHDMDIGMEENIKTPEMDLGVTKGSANSRNSYSIHPQSERTDCRLSTHRPSSRQDNNNNNNSCSRVSPAPSALTDMGPRACSGHFEDYTFGMAQSSPQYCSSAVSKADLSRLPFAFPKPDCADSLSYDYPLYPSYMANTESSRAKFRSQSAPKQRPADSFERQSSQRRASIEGRNVPRAVRMQRSSSHAGATAKNYQYPRSIKLDRSTVSLKDSECGSTSTVLTNTNYCRSLVRFDVSIT